MWIVSGMGISMGYHRLFSHKAYKTNAFVRFIVLVAGATAIQNSALTWSSDHRRHHLNVDHDLEDPYSISNGFWWAHIGWVFFKTERENNLDNVNDLMKDPLVTWQHRNYLAITTVANLAIPIICGLLFGNVLQMLIFAVLAKIVVSHHFTFCINSLAHIWGSQPWSTTNSAKDNWFISLFTFGEGYHNYHHAFEADYRNGPLWYNYDPSKWVIWVLSKIGFTADLKSMPAERVFRRRYQERKALSPNMEQFNIWLHSAEDQQKEMVLYLKTRLEQTESALEEKLSNLRDIQRKWKKAHRAQMNPEKWRAQMKKSQASAKRTLREWEQLMETYLEEIQGLSPQFA
jgi:stearoyl-CoA desaturase (delta-9 desaturase)